MNSHNLTPAQLQEIHDHLWPAANYLVRLKQKMEQRHFPRNDQLYLKTVDAYDHLLTLLHELHGRACGTHWAGTERAFPASSSE